MEHTYARSHIRTYAVPRRTLPGPARRLDQSISASKNSDGKHVSQQELFLQGLHQLESIVRGDLVDNEEDVEELALIIERGGELPMIRGVGYGGVGRKHRSPPRESATSFLKRLEAGLVTFQEAVAGKLKVGHILPDPPSEDDKRALASFLTDLPEDRSTYAPEIPEREMAMYNFGERVLYVLRRGFKAKSVRKPLELLDSYGLLDEENITLETQLYGICERGGEAEGGIRGEGKDGVSIRGTPAILRHCAVLDRLATHIQCSNLLFSFPKLRDPSQFRDQPEQPVAQATCDVMIFIPVPDFYRSYLASRGEGYNPISVQEQIDRGIDLPKSLSSHIRPGDEQAAKLPALVGSAQACLALASAGADMLGKDWLTYPELGVFGDENGWGGRGRGGGGIRAVENSLVDDNEDSSSDMLSPDEAEAILRTLFGDDFDSIAQQLPRKRTTPLHMDPEYQCMFEETAREMNELRLAMTWTFNVNLVRRIVSGVTVNLSWINLGPVHERDLFPLLHYMMNADE